MVHPFEETGRTGHIVSLISHPLTPSSVLYTFGLNTGEFYLDIFINVLCLVRIVKSIRKGWLYHNISRVIILEGSVCFDPIDIMARIFWCRISQIGLNLE